MADSTLQYQWITKIQGGCDALFKDDPNVFVAGDLLWYPVEGNNTISQAPDVNNEIIEAARHRPTRRVRAVTPI